MLPPAYRDRRETLEELVIARWGTPCRTITDNGTQFLNWTLREFMEECGIKLETTPPYHLQANPVERVNRALNTMIVAYLDRDHREWHMHLRDFRFVYNTAWHSSIGTSPAFLNFGRELEVPRSVCRRCTAEEGVVVRDPVEWTERIKR